MKLTKHARIRCKQRAISEEVLRIIITYGLGEKVDGNVRKIFLNKRGLDDFIHKLKGLIQMIEKLKRVRLIVTNDEDNVITAYHERHSSQ